MRGVSINNPASREDAATVDVEDDDILLKPRTDNGNERSQRAFSLGRRGLICRSAVPTGEGDSSAIQRRICQRREKRYLMTVRREA